MARYLLEILTSPVRGQEAEYNRWYDDIHLAEVLALDGFVSARRFKLNEPGQETYLALYEVETDDPASILPQLSRASASMHMSTALDTATAQVRLFEALG